MIKFTIYTFSAGTSCKIDTKPRRSFLCKLICFCIPSIYFRIAFIQRWSSFDMLVSISQKLIIPNIIIIVSFNICSFFFRFLNLSTSRFGHEFLHLLISKLLKQFVFLLELGILFIKLVLIIFFVLINIVVFVIVLFL